jgi:hypothetical protein
LVRSAGLAYERDALNIEVRGLHAPGSYSLSQACFQLLDVAIYDLGMREIGPLQVLIG